MGVKSGAGAYWRFKGICGPESASGIVGQRPQNIQLDFVGEDLRVRTHVLKVFARQTSSGNAGESG